MKSPNISIYYSIIDPYPAYRVDLSELVAKSLSTLHVDTAWFMAADSVDPRAGRRDYFSQQCQVPRRYAGGALARLGSRLAYWLSDAGHMLRAAGGRYDVLQTRDKYLVSLLALAAARLSGKRFVYWCSYPFPEHALELARERGGLKGALLALKGRLAMFTLYRVVMRYADHNFVQSEQMLRDLATYGIAVERMTPVPMGVPQRLLDWAAARAVPVVPGRVVYLGTMASVRRLHVLIEAFALLRRRCPQATLLMVGDGDFPHEREALQRQVAELGLAEAVRFTGQVPIEEAWALSSSAAVCVSPFYPSKILASTSPTKLVEYMAMGRPVVCNDHPEQSAIIRDSGAGLCVAWDPARFADALAWMLEHPDQAEQMGARGPAWVAAARTYPIIAEAVRLKYQQLLNRAD